MKKTLFFFVILIITITKAQALSIYTNIPDPNFEQVLINKGLDSGVLDGKVLTSSIARITSLSVQNENISDLTGIQDFAALTSLVCYNNSLIALDLTKNTALTYLSCYSNQLTVLDVTQNTALTYLSCYSNKITVLDVIKNTALQTLLCYSNQLTALDVTQNIALEYLNCHHNSLTALDVTKNSALTRFYCFSNKLVNLNIQNGSNIQMHFFNSSDNPNLSCIQADSATPPPGAGWTKDATVSYSTTACALSSPAFEKNENSILLSPNPTNNVVNVVVSAGIELKKVEVYTLTGKKIETPTQSQVSLNHLANGEYLFIIETNNGRSTKKVIKK
jgi:hypothetical protein